jgi:hypothetical protein
LLLMSIFHGRYWSSSSHTVILRLSFVHLFVHPSTIFPLTGVPLGEIQFAVILMSSENKLSHLDVILFALLYSVIINCLFFFLVCFICYPLLSFVICVCMLCFFCCEQVAKG